MDQVFRELLYKTQLLKESYSDGLDHRHGIVRNGENVTWDNSANKEYWWMFGSACCKNNPAHKLCCFPDFL